MVSRISFRAGLAHALVGLALMVGVDARAGGQSGDRGASDRRTREAEALAAAHWQAAARADVEGLRQILADNHPGAVDPQNRAFADWLERGYRLARREAGSVRTQADYVRALRRYANGFQDGHLVVSFSSMQASQWPGFLARETGDGTLTVNVAEPGGPLAEGAIIRSCDGRGGTALVDTLVAPFRINAAIPHQREEKVPFVFIAAPDDRLRPQRCVVRDRTGERTMVLEWRTLDPSSPRASLTSYINASAGIVQPAMGMRDVDGAHWISLPTFNLFNEQSQLILDLLARIEASRDDLRDGRDLVIDVRGNGGGNSGWGQRVATALYGADLVEPVANSFDWTVDWRASLANRDSLLADARRSDVSNQPEDAETRRSLATRMEEAMAAGLPYLHSAAQSSPAPAGPPASPFKGRVFLLTDGRCASACLDFMDIMTRMPGVIHVGQPTSADAIYIDNYGMTLPSGHANLSLSRKVYRNRVRGNNQWYTPVHLLEDTAAPDATLLEQMRGLAGG